MPDDEIKRELDRVLGPEDVDDRHGSAPASPIRFHKGRPVGPHRPPLRDDMVVLPKHYARWEIEPIHFLIANKTNGFQFNIVKYTMRAEHKHEDKGRQDLLKVVRYTMMYAKFLAGDPDWWKPYRNPALAAAIEQELTYAPNEG